MPIGCFFHANDDKIIGQAKVLNYEGDFSQAQIELNSTLENLDSEQAASETLVKMQENNLESILKDLEKDPPDLGEL